MKVLLDTNMMMLPAQLGVDIYEQLGEHELITLMSCINELTKLGRKKTKDGKAARVALQLVKEKGVKIVKTAHSGDRALTDYASNNMCAVATNDAVLIKALKKYGIKVIRLRQNKFLTEEE